MGVVFTYIASPPENSLCLMDCSVNWAKHFVRFSDFVSREYDYPSIFLWDGEVISDSIYVDLQNMQQLFIATSKNTDRLLIGWAEYVAGMLEIATKQYWGHEWKQKFNHFCPIHRGVNREDIPIFE